MEDQDPLYYVMVGNQFLHDYSQDNSRKTFHWFTMTANPDEACPYEKEEKAREHATRLRYMLESTNARVVQKVIQTVYKDVPFGDTE